MEEGECRRRIGKSSQLNLLGNRGRVRRGYTRMMTSHSFYSCGPWQHFNVMNLGNPPKGEKLEYLERITYQVLFAAERALQFIQKEKSEVLSHITQNSP